MVQRENQLLKITLLSLTHTLARTHMHMHTHARARITRTQEGDAREKL